MKIHLLPVGLSLLLMSCNQTPKPSNTANKSDSIKFQKTKALIAKQVCDGKSGHSWTDSLLTIYLKHSGNNLVDTAVNDISINEECMFDRTEKRGKSTFYVYNVGHDTNNGDGVVFTSDSWVFIDSLSRKLYEYQPDERLKEWKQ